MLREESASVETAAPMTLMQKIASSNSLEVKAAIIANAIDMQDPEVPSILETHIPLPEGRYTTLLHLLLIFAQTDSVTTVLDWLPSLLERARLLEATDSDNISATDRLRLAMQDHTLFMLQHGEEIHDPSRLELLWARIHSCGGPRQMAAFIIQLLRSEDSSLDVKIDKFLLSESILKPISIPGKSATTTMIILMAAYGSPVELKMLLRSSKIQSEALNTPDSTGYYPLHIALRQQPQSGIPEWLAIHGADLTRCTPHQANAFHIGMAADPEKAQQFMQWSLSHPKLAYTAQRACQQPDMFGRTPKEITAGFKYPALAQAQGPEMSVRVFPDPSRVLLRGHIEGSVVVIDSVCSTLRCRSFLPFHQRDTVTVVSVPETTALSVQVLDDSTDAKKRTKKPPTAF